MYPIAAVLAGVLLAVPTTEQPYRKVDPPAAPAPVTIPARLQGTITGRVVDAQTGQPIATAQVFISGTGVGALTRADGGYLLVDVPDGTHVLQVQRIGYRPASQDVTVAPDRPVVLNFELNREALALDEVIVTGTPGGTQRRAIGNVVERMDMSAIAEVSPAVTIEHALGSKVPGLTMLATPGQAGGGTQMRIRGSSSLALSGDPLIYVDGIRINSDRAFVGRYGSISTLGDINTADIESIEVIKGPAAATLYGTEASNGVIQIITKRGLQGAATFDASAELGTQWIPDPAEKFGLHWRIDPATGEPVSHNLYLLEQEPDRFGKPLYQNGLMQRYHVAVRGGTDLVRYSASVNRSDVEGVSRYDWDERNSGHLSLSLVPRESFSITLNAQKTSGANRDPSSYFVSAAAFANPPAVNGRTRGYSARPHEASIHGRTDITYSDRDTWSAELRHEATSWLTQRLVAGIDETAATRESLTFRDPEGYGAFWGQAGREGRKDVTSISTPTSTLDYGATVTASLPADVSAATSVGVQYYSRERKQTFVRGDNFAVKALTTVEAAARTEGSESFIENTTLGAYVQQQFGWRNRRFLTAAVRADDNSAFGTEFDAAIYPKLSAAWVLSEEGFWESGLVSELRLRGAWGAAGKQPDVFAAQRLFESVTGPGSQPILSPVAYGNPDLGPERGEELELGFDVAFWEGRVGLDFTWYSRSTRDAMVKRPVRPSIGFPGDQLLNIGQVSTWGTEWGLDAQILTRDPLRWNLTVAFSTNGNRIDDLGGLEQIVVTTLDGIPSRGQLHVEEFPIAGLFDYKVLSADFVNGNRGPVTNLICDGGTGRGGREMGGAPVPCSEAPTVFWGQVDPSWTLNLTSSFTVFRNVTLAATIDARGGHTITSDYLAALNTRGSRPMIFQDDPIFMAYETLRSNSNSTVMQDAGFAKLREVSLQYALPVRLAERMGASAASVHVGMYNAAVLWWQQKYTDFGQRAWDPEMPPSAYHEFAGVPTGVNPPLSHVTARVNVTF